MTPGELEKYRKTTDSVSRFAVSPTQLCPRCKKTRSITQFDAGKKVCRPCRKGK